MKYLIYPSKALSFGNSNVAFGIYDAHSNGSQSPQQRAFPSEPLEQLKRSENITMLHLISKNRKYVFRNRGEKV